MAKSIKLGSDTYLDASGIVVDANGKTLSKQLPSSISFLNTYIPASGSIVITLNTTTRGMIFITGAGGSGSTTARGIVAFNGSTSTVLATILVGASALSITSENNAMTMTNQSTAAALYLNLLIFSGDVSVN